MADGRRLAVLGAAAALALPILVGCSDDGGGRSGGPTTTAVDGDGEAAEAVPATVPTPITPELTEELRNRIEASLPRAGSYAADHLEEADPASLAFYDYLWRNWAVPGLEGARDVAASLPPSTEPSYAIFRRLVDPAAERPERPDEDVDALEYDLMVAALHCDQVPLEDGFAQLVRDQASGGPLELSHSAYAVAWVRELGCTAAGVEDAAQALVGVMAESLAEQTEVGDETLLLSVGLSYLGRADQVPVAWTTAVLDAQREDGGWSEQAGGDGSSWHTTGLAIWTLAAVAGPGEGVPLVLTD